MERVYKKLIEKINSMSQEEKDKEWDELKKYNKIEPMEKRKIIACCMCELRGTCEFYLYGESITCLKSGEKTPDETKCDFTVIDGEF